MLGHATHWEEEEEEEGEGEEEEDKGEETRKEEREEEVEEDARFARDIFPRPGGVMPRLEIIRAVSPGTFSPIQASRCGSRRIPARFA